MPWSITQDHPECDGWAVVKDDTNELEGCHPSESDAQEQVAALNASERTDSRPPKRVASWLFGVLVRHGTHDQSNHGNWSLDASFNVPSGDDRSYSDGAFDLAERGQGTGGGFSVDLSDGSEPTSGFMVGGEAEERSITPRFGDRSEQKALPGLNTEADAEEIQSFIEDNRSSLAKSGNMLGGWRRPGDDKLVLDVARNESNPKVAGSLTVARGEDSMYDIVADEAVDPRENPGWQDADVLAAFRDRGAVDPNEVLDVVDELEREGRGDDANRLRIALEMDAEVGNLPTMRKVNDRLEKGDIPGQDVDTPTPDPLAGGDGQTWGRGGGTPGWVIDSDQGRPDPGDIPRGQRRNDTLPPVAASPSPSTPDSVDNYRSRTSRIEDALDSNPDASDIAKAVEVGDAQGIEYVQFGDGTEAMRRPNGGTPLGGGYMARDIADREHTFSRMAAAMGAGDQVPATVQEEAGGRRVTYQEVIDGGAEGGVIPDGSTLQAINTVTGNSDRHGGNVLTRPDGTTVTIDNALWKANDAGQFQVEKAEQAFPDDYDFDTAIDNMKDVRDSAPNGQMANQVDIVIGNLEKVKTERMSAPGRFA